MSNVNRSSYDESFRPPVRGFENVLLRPERFPMIDTLANRYCRLVLLLLKNGTLENETDAMVRGTTDPEEVETELVYDHLPKLEEAGYIEWDRETGEISEGPRFDEIRPVLELIENHSDELPPEWL